VTIFYSACNCPTAVRRASVSRAVSKRTPPCHSSVKNVDVYIQTGSIKKAVKEATRTAVSYYCAYSFPRPVSVRLVFEQVRLGQVFWHCCLPQPVLFYQSSIFIDLWLTPWSRVLPQKLKRPKLLKKFPAFYGTRRFNTAFTGACHLSLSWAR
jgi:hypothetical protein